MSSLVTHAGTSIEVAKVGRRRDRVAGWLRKAGLFLALAPTVLGWAQALLSIFPTDAFHSIWRHIVGRGPGAAVVAMVASALVYAITGRVGKPGTLTIATDRIVAAREGGAVVADARALSGSVTPLADGARLEVAVEGGDTVFAAFPTLEAADDALARLELGPQRRALTIAATSPERATLRSLFTAAGTVVMMLIFLGMVLVKFDETPPQWLIPSWLALTIGVAWGAVRVVRPKLIRIGVDGVAIQGSVFSRFVSFKDVVAVEAHNSEVALTLRSGEALFVSTQTPSIVATVIHRIREIQKGGVPLTSDELAAKVAPGGRSAAALRAELATWLRGGSAFRSQPVSVTDLEALLLDPARSLGVRIGAALALRELGDEPRERVRIASEAAVEPRLSRALRVIGGRPEDPKGLDEAALDDALRVAAAEEEASSTAQEPS